MKNDIKVSIFCSVYNHENYIREALDSFIMQKTNFAFEVLVHDDASTDHSPDIIRMYESQYPNIIKPIYQKENQHSQGIQYNEVYQLPLTKGKYIALCEGDDYWTDPYKLQKQYDEMEQHPELDMCAHSASKLRGKAICGTISSAKEKTVFDTNDVILGGGGFFATNSLFYRTKMWTVVPAFYRYLSFDYSLQIWGSLRGGILYLPDNMAVYRTAVRNSWSERMKNDETKYFEHVEKVKEMLMILDQHTNGCYHEAIQQHIADNAIYILLLQHRYYEITHGEYSRFYNAYPFKKKAFLKVKQLLHYFGVL